MPETVENPQPEDESLILNRLVEAAGNAFLGLSQSDCTRLQFMSSAFLNFTGPLADNIRNQDLTKAVRKLYATMAIWTALDYLLSNDDQPSTKALAARAVRATEKRLKAVVKPKRKPKRKSSG